MCCLIPARETIPRLKKEKLRQAPQDRGACRSFSYGIFGMGVDRKHEAKWLFPFRGPRGQVFVRGVEVKATFDALIEGTLTLVLLERPGHLHSSHPQCGWNNLTKMSHNTSVYASGQ
jgi:hypothetical protein